VTIAFIGIGANLDDPEAYVKRATLERATLELDRLPRTRVLRASSLYRSAPIGYVSQPEFVNAVAQVETALSPAELLGELQALEARHGRVRSFPNAPRTLDLDLLLHGGTQLCSPDLTLPHPRMHERAFVLAPLLEIAPEAVIPGLGPAKALLEPLRGQAVERIG
jgi:2-amino-4-hydroxy-6-hydroxymethyldihydropteridine diphosphokinase